MAKSLAQQIEELQQRQKAELLAKVPELNRLYKACLEQLTEIKNDHKDFTPYWLIPQGVAYRIAKHLQSKATDGKPLGSDTTTNIIKALVAENYYQPDITDTLDERKVKADDTEGKDRNGKPCLIAGASSKEKAGKVVRRLWRTDGTTYTLLKAFNPNEEAQGETEQN